MIYVKNIAIVANTLLLLFLLTTPLPISAIDYYSAAATSVSARIDDTTVTINGFTSPFSKVELTGVNVYSQTFSDETGYFEFTQTQLPKNPPELCLQSFDDSQRLSQLTCLPSPPPTEYTTTIGPILLPPTLTLDTNSIEPNSTTHASGQSIPNSDIDIYLFKVSDSAPSFPKAANAYSLPIFSTSSDEQGNFSFSLPTAYSSNYRLFASVKYFDETSPKSTTLTYSLPSLIYLFWIRNSFLIIFLPIFLLTVLLLIYLSLKSRTITHNYPAVFEKRLVPFTYYRQRQ